MTAHVNDLVHSDVILVAGANPAENHPCAFRWIAAAMDRGARLLVVDPRMTRSAALADLYAPIRSGTDVAFFGGMIRYILEHKLYQEAYVCEYTNAAFLLHPDFAAAEQGLFSGYDASTCCYDKATWSYQIDEGGLPRRDPTMTDPRTVLQWMRRHYTRYTLETVSRITGTPPEVLEAAYATYARTGRTDASGAIVYAMGQTQHSCGTQNVESLALVQLLLGNIGVPGGQIAALRGLHNVQGSTDFGALYHNLPGYLAAPTSRDLSLGAFLQRVTPRSADPRSHNGWKNYPCYLVSLLKAWYGDEADRVNDFAFHRLPKIEPGKDYSHMALFDAMAAGTVRGLLLVGQNPAVDGPDAGAERRALERLDWMVAVDLWETETAAFWKRPGCRPADVRTEVFFLPAASWVEREGSVSNTGRWVQWRPRAIEPVGESRPDTWIVNQIVRRVRSLYAAEGGAYPEAVLGLTWEYGDGLPDAEAVLREINGRAVADVKDDRGEVLLRAGEQVPGFASLRDDGSTSCGNWLYCGVHPAWGNLARRRDPTDPSGLEIHPAWAWSWPMNRRILYNRASVRPDGTPWAPGRAAVRWDAGTGAWSGDVVDGGGPPGAVLPFIMLPEGVARLFNPSLAEGPFPEHYEAWESPVPNLLSGQRHNPVARFPGPEGVRPGEVARYPIVCTTVRICEHLASGAMTRNLPWLVEQQPGPFVEMSESLAGAKGIRNGDRVAVESARGRVEMTAMVTPRVRPLQVNGRVVHQVAVVWHWGYQGLTTGDSANVLTPAVGDPNTATPEYKTFLCDVNKTVV